MSTTNTTATTPAELSRRFVDAVNAGTIDELAMILDPAIVDHHLPPGVPAGIQGIAYWCGLLHDALQIRVSIEDLVSQGDRVAVRARITGTHVGEFAGLPPTNRSFDASFLSIERVAGGRIVERWEIPDNATIMAQLTGDA